MTSNNRLDDAMVVKSCHVVRDKSRAIGDDKGADVLLRTHITLVAADKKRQLQQCVWPQIWLFGADMPRGIGEGECMGEIEPADIVRDLLVGGGIETQVEMQQVPRRRSEQRVIKLARRAPG